MTAQLFDLMLAEAERVITQTWGLEWHDVGLVSGGDAWAGTTCYTLSS
jgi:hypothetical protein